MPDNRIKRYIKSTKPSGNPRKDRGKTQRIYLLRIHEQETETVDEIESCKLSRSDTDSDTDSDCSDSDSSLSSDDSSDSEHEIQTKKKTVQALNLLERKFDLCGTTGNVYTVTINKSPLCSCPDHTQRKNRCKHIFFILVRIMKVSTENEDKLEYDDVDLEDMFDNMPTHMTEIQSGAKADSSMLNKYSKLNVKTNKDGTVKPQRITGDSRCPVCLDNLKGSTEPVSHCKYGCGSIVHNECAKMYNAHRKKTGYHAICFVCQKRWNPVDDPDDNQYLNLQ
jgi:hypothetical protein